MTLLELTIITLVSTTSSSVPVIESLIILLVVSELIRLILAPVGVVVARMVVLIAETVGVTHATVDIEDSLNHANARLAAEVLPIDVVDLPLFHDLGWQNGVLKQDCLVLCVPWMDVADFQHVIALADELHLVVKSLPLQPVT